MAACDRYAGVAGQGAAFGPRHSRASARFLICAVGALSAAHRPDIPGIDDFGGECYHTGDWPRQPVSFAGKRVGVIGTGSSGVQSIPVIAREAAHLTVFQRTPQYSIPSRNRFVTPAEQLHARENWDDIRALMRRNYGGAPFLINQRTASEDTPEERQALLEKLWEEGTLNFLTGNYADLLTSEETNHMVAEFVRGKIREVVRDPDTIEKLMPDYYLGTKRPILDLGYFETFNRDNVALVDLRRDRSRRSRHQAYRQLWANTRSTCSCWQRASMRSPAPFCGSIPGDVTASVSGRNGATASTTTSV